MKSLNTTRVRSRMVVKTRINTAHINDVMPIASDRLWDMADKVFYSELQHTRSGTRSVLEERYA